MQRKLIIMLAAVLALTACDLPDEPDEEPEAAPNATLGEEEEEALEEECPDVSAPEGAPAGVTMMDTFFEPACVAVSSEQPVALTNAGNLDHNFTIDGSDLSLDVGPGEDEETDEVGELVEAGTYRFYCRFHERQGMVGTIVVE